MNSRGFAVCSRDGRQMLSRELVQEATDFGLRMMNHLIEEQEPELFKRGKFLLALYYLLTNGDQMKSRLLKQL